MTKKKSKGESRYSELELSLYRARKIAVDLEADTLTPQDREFLIYALRKVGEGEDPSAVFGVKARRGEKRSPESRKKADRMIFVLPWVSTAMRPPPDGFGLELDDALSLAATAFGFSEETLRTYWTDYPELRTPSFNPPISSLPIRQKK